MIFGFKVPTGIVGQLLIHVLCTQTQFTGGAIRLGHTRESDRVKVLSTVYNARASANKTSTQVQKEHSRIAHLIHTFYKHFILNCRAIILIQHIVFQRTSALLSGL